MKEQQIYNQQQIERDLVNLGIRKGDTLFIRISYKAIGKIEGGPLSFIKALMAVIGEDGTILMTAFPKKHIRQFRWFYRNEVHSKQNIAKPITGAIPTLALTLKEARISKKLEFPFIVIGKHADYLTSSHTHEKYGYWILQEAIEKFACKCLRIGGEPFLGSTHIAFDIVFKEKGYCQKKLMNGLYLLEDGRKVWREQPGTVFCRPGFKLYVDEIVSASIVANGKVGNGEAVLTDMRKSLNKELEMFRKDIRITLCRNPYCLYCRTSFSFSDENRWVYLKRLLLLIPTNQWRRGLGLLWAFLKNELFGIRVKW